MNASPSSVFIAVCVCVHVSGVMGLATARALQSLGYKVSGWSRAQPSPQQQQERAGITSYVGQQQLQEFVAQQDVLVCLLPLTQQTTGGCRSCDRLQGSVLSWDVLMTALHSTLVALQACIDPVDSAALM